MKSNGRKVQRYRLRYRVEGDSMVFLTEISAVSTREAIQKLKETDTRRTVNVQSVCPVGKG